VVRDGEQDAVRRAVEPFLDDGAPEVAMVTGGETRHASEWQALSLLATEIDTGELDVVAIHDAARPLASAELYVRVLAEAARRGAAIPVVAEHGLVRRDGGPLPDRLAGVQTPQAFRAEDLLAAYRLAEADGFAATDTAGCLSHYVDLPIAAVESTAANLKLTVADDFAVAGVLVDD
jgi:2-C-methyl-D-erythritol 4-phosphate cytidylyltransferase